MGALETFLQCDGDSKMKTHSLLQVAAFCLSVVLVNGFRKRAIIAERLPRWGVLTASLKCNDMPLSLAEQGRLSISRVAPIVNAIVAIFLASKANAAGPAYLVEPTAEFLEEEQRVSAFNAAQGKIRKDWDEIVGKLQVSDDPKVTAQLLRDLKAFLVKLQDLVRLVPHS